MQQWFRPTVAATVLHAENDLRTGGDYRIDIQTATNAPQRVSGLYHAISAPTQLAFTWRWGDETEDEDTYVEISLRPLPQNETMLTLLHDEFQTAAARDHHLSFWEGVLTRLAAYVDNNKLGE